MPILILNCGSSSIKFELRENDGEKLLCRGLIEKIGEKKGALHVAAASGRKIERRLHLADHSFALRQMMRLLACPDLGVLGSLAEIEAVGHRVVHGGEEYSESVLLDEKAVDTIDRLSEIAPLHNPHNLKGITACRELLPGVPQVGVFDTAFHAPMPETAYIYALPRALYDKYRIRRYGFHGTSHGYVHARALELAGLEGKPSRIVTAHLGNGCSAAAVRDGKVVDTSMGFTPLEGLVMGTRTGDIDAALPFYLLDRGIPEQEVVRIFQKQSGLLGLSGGLANDMRTLLENYEKNPLARLAIEVYCYRLKKYIGAYTAALGGLDVLVFTGGVGENAELVRQRTCAGLEGRGGRRDARRNAAGSGKEALISTASSPAKVYVIPTDEELVIARETCRLVTSLRDGAKRKEGKKGRKGKTCRRTKKKKKGKKAKRKRAHGIR